MPWLELMDTKKWPHEAYKRLREEKAMPAQQDFVAPHALAAHASVVSGGGLPIFNVAVNSDGDSLAVMAADLHNLNRLLKHTTLVQHSRDALAKLVMDYGTGGAVEPSDYQHVVTRIMKGDSITDVRDLEFVEQFLLMLYNNFDREGFRVVDASELIAALCILSPGSKSDKLAFIFGLYDERGHSALESYQMHCFLRALLVTLATIATIVPSGNGLDGNNRDEQMSVDVAALEMTDIVFDEASAEDTSAASGRSVTFDAFADWYTYGGHATMPWLELLDLSKWTSGAMTSGASLAEEAGDVADAVGDKDEGEGGYGKRVDGGDMPVGMSGRSRKQSFLEDDEEFAAANAVHPAAIPAVFEFIISSTGSKLRVFAKDIEIVVDTVSLAGFQARSVDGMRGIFSKAGARDQHGQSLQRLSLGQFEACVMEILTSGNEVDRLESDEFEFVSAVLAGVFHSLDTCEDHENVGTVSVDELVAGFSVFVGQGTKSEKLASIFDAFDSDKAGLVSKHTLWRYLRSILAALSHLTEIMPGDGMSFSAVTAGDSTFNRVVEEAIDELVDAIFDFRNGQQGEDADGAFGDDLISFDTFAQWYTNGGFELCAWLELLDHRKWLPLSKPGSAAPVVAASPNDLMAASIAQAANPPPSAEYGALSDPGYEYDSLFEFQIDAAGRKMIICSHDCQILRYLLFISKFDSVAPIAIPHAMALVLGRNADWSATNEDDDFAGADVGINGGAPLDCDTFLKAVEILLDQSFLSCKQTEQDFFLLNMRNVHRAFTQAESDARVLQNGNGARAGKVSAAMLTSGMLLFAEGSKSEKLSIAFDLFGSESANEAARVDADMFSLFLLSFMVIISMQTRHGRSKDMGVLHLAARGLARQVFNAVGKLKTGHELVPDSITFQDFADWYTAEGHELVPWLELLDLRKWPSLMDGRDGGAGNMGDSASEESASEEEEEEEEEEGIYEQEYKREYKEHLDAWEMSSESGDDTFADFEEFERQLA
jgi:Ca2+-binding EF-hand superfamily protein